MRRFPLLDQLVEAGGDECIKLNHLPQILVKLHVFGFIPDSQYIFQHLVQSPYRLDPLEGGMKPSVQINPEVPLAVAAKRDVIDGAVFHEQVERVAGGTFAGREKRLDLVKILVRRFGQ